MNGKKGLNCPFQVLQGKISKELLPPERIIASDSEDIDFEEVMNGVKKLPDKEKLFWKLTSKRPKFSTEEKFSTRELLRIRIRETSEYVEELVRGFQKEIFDALHEGKISVCRTLNLRRLLVPEALEALENFIKESLIRGDHCVLIIHGRGLSSPKDPVLKTKVHEWFKKGPYRKHIIGFCTARQCDGGLGATYVLLSSKPLKKTLAGCT
ncbi:Smr protein/MutS2 [Thermodesulfatator indicus DSM 15286]|uniref:Smr protein/MutS2 n=1 Tax=Thermodesulfatator indicus (strain DSM 15286 / JCM 11887 / CIR29812) TaxID=667014 RepID=F8ADX7_THEID|nr:Smr/MutS family protein [Thermodesulfatator indicus]AEH44942.1 Smr protein/MutS2 [Thermodesulfatator indicus DSM 15286]